MVTAEECRRLIAPQRAQPRRSPGTPHLAGSGILYNLLTQDLRAGLRLWRPSGLAVQASRGRVIGKPSRFHTTDSRSLAAWRPPVMTTTWEGWWTRGLAARSGRCDRRWVSPAEAGSGNSI